MHTQFNFTSTILMGLALVMAIPAIAGGPSQEDERKSISKRPSSTNRKVERNESALKSRNTKSLQPKRDSRTSISSEQLPEEFKFSNWMAEHPNLQRRSDAFKADSPTVRVEYPVVNEPEAERRDILDTTRWLVKVVENEIQERRRTPRKINPSDWPLDLFQHHIDLRSSFQKTALKGENKPTSPVNSKVEEQEEEKPKRSDWWIRTLNRLCSPVFDRNLPLPELGWLDNIWEGGKKWNRVTPVNHKQL